MWGKPASSTPTVKCTSYPTQAWAAVKTQGYYKKGGVAAKGCTGKVLDTLE